MSNTRWVQSDQKPNLVFEDNMGMININKPVGMFESAKLAKIACETFNAAKTRLNQIMKLRMRKNYKYGVDANERMKQGTMTNTEYNIGGGVTMILVAEGWHADDLIEDALKRIVVIKAE